MDISGINRRDFITGISAMTLMPSIAAAQSRWPLTVTDAVGRRVTIPKKPQAVILATGFNLVALSLIRTPSACLQAGQAI